MAMKKAGISFLATVALLSAFSVSAKDAQIPDSAIAQRIINQSIANYSGNCPCPYNTMRNGRSCGGRSAYSRPGGRAPICYEEDVTPAMVKAYRQRMKN
jgi:hypothetical protein